MNLDALLISRDATLLAVLRPALEKISVNLEACTEPRAGNDRMAKRKFDAVIVDCDDLPNGGDLLKALRQTQSNSRSVAFAVVNGKTTTQEAFKVEPISSCRNRSPRCMPPAVLMRHSISWCGSGAATSGIG